MFIREQISKNTADLMSSSLGFEERAILLNVEGNTRDLVVANLNKLIETTDPTSEGEMFVHISKGLIDKLLTKNINISAERALGNVLE